METSITSERVRIRQDNQHDLDELFRVAISQANQGLTGMGTPLRQRNLPASFFTPPETGTRSTSHSRESSLDQSGPFSPPPGSGARTPASPLSPAASTLTIAGNCNVAIPSPVPPSIQPTQQQGRLVAHSRAHSSPATLPSIALSVAPAPATNGALQLAHPAPPNSTTGPIHVRHLSYDVEKMKLPDGWEMAYDPTGKRYFIDHNNKKTTWEDPRLQILQQLQQRHNQMLQEKLQQQQQVLAAAQQQQLTATQNLPPLPEGWEQRRTADGVPYFANHNDQTTQWTDPRLTNGVSIVASRGGPPPPPIHQQQPPIAQSPLINGSGGLHAVAGHNLRVQQIMKEREKLRQQQEASRFALSDESIATSVATMTNTISTTGIDPFLGSINLADCHSRQESGDSGLGLGSFSLPRTPEGLLNSDDTGLQTTQSVVEDLALDGLNITGMDLGTETSMESDDLMSNLPVLDGADEIQAADLSDLEAFLSNNKTNIWL